MDREGNLEDEIHMLDWVWWSTPEIPPSSREADAENLRALGQLGLCRETLTQNNLHTPRKVYDQNSWDPCSR